MLLKHIGLLFFAENDPAPTPAPAPEPAPEKTFTQSEVEAKISKRLAQAMKDMPKGEAPRMFSSSDSGSIRNMSGKP